MAVLSSFIAPSSSTYHPADGFHWVLIGSSVTYKPPSSYRETSPSVGRTNLSSSDTALWEVKLMKVITEFFLAYERNSDNTLSSYKILINRFSNILLWWVIQREKWLGAAVLCSAPVILWCQTKPILARTLIHEAQIVLTRGRIEKEEEFTGMTFLTNN